MKILLIEPEYQGHHVALHLNLLINEFHKRKWHISILTYKKSIISEPYKLIDKKIFTKIDFFYIKKVEFNNVFSSFSSLSFNFCIGIPNTLFDSIVRSLLRIWEQSGGKWK